MASIVANSTTQLQNNGAEGISSNPYVMFKFSTRSEITRKYYERRIRHFLDFIKFDLENKSNVEGRCNAFAYKGGR
jgi:hypothetical protein